MLAAPTAALTAAEVAALHEYVDGGGSLVVFSGEGGPAAHGSNLNDVVGKCVLLQRCCDWVGNSAPLTPLPPPTRTPPPTPRPSPGTPILFAQVRPHLQR